MVIIQNISIYLSEAAVFRIITEMYYSTCRRGTDYKSGLQSEQHYLDCVAYSFCTIMAAVP